MLNRLAEKAALTKDELKIFLFLIFILSAGLIYKNTRDSSSKPRVFDYSVKDSLFLNAEYIPDSTNPKEAEFDYKREVLDFNKPVFPELKLKKTALEKSIDLNKCNAGDLITIPGLGEKTAQKIIDYRNTAGSFKKIEELMNIRGIGTAKFEKIKLFVYVK